MLSPKFASVYRSSVTLPKRIRAFTSYIFKVKDGVITDRDGRTIGQLAAVENNLAFAKYSLDNSETLTDNERRALGKVKDTMSFGEARELFLAKENHTLGQVLQVYKLRERRFGEGSNETNIVKDALREAYQDATGKRRELTTEENVSNLARLLRSQNKAREGSYLAKDIQRLIDAGRNGNINELTQIPGEYRSMYTKAEKILGIKEEYSVAPKHSDEQGAFSVAPNEPAGSPNRIRTAIGKLLGLQENLEANVKRALQALLWAGDASSEECTSEQLKAEGFSDNAIAVSGKFYKRL